MNKQEYERSLTPSMLLTHALHGVRGSVLAAYPVALVLVGVVYAGWASICTIAWPSVKSVDTIYMIGGGLVTLLVEALVTVIIGYRLLGQSPFALCAIERFFESIVPLILLKMFIFAVAAIIAFGNTTLPGAFLPAIIISILNFLVLSAFLWLFVHCVAAIPIIVVEGVFSIEGLKRSKQLVRSRGWQILFAWILVLAVNFAVGLGLWSKNIWDYRFYWIHAGVMTLFKSLLMGLLVKIYLGWRAESAANYTLDSLRCELDRISVDMDSAKYI